MIAMQITGLIDSISEDLKQQPFGYYLANSQKDSSSGFGFVFGISGLDQDARWAFAMKQAIGNAKKAKRHYIQREWHKARGAFESALEGFAREYRLLISFYRERFRRKVSAEGKKGEEMGDVRCGMCDH